MTSQMTSAGNKAGSSQTLASALVPDMLGATIDDGRLHLVEQLGEGAYGVVYRAVDLQYPSSSSDSGPKEYAVKILAKQDELSNIAYLQRQEIRVHKTMSKHPNILTLHDVVDDGKFLYLITEFCRGGDMLAAINDRAAYSRNDDLVKKVFIQILDAVQACHEEGIFHRDLKPDNIFCKDEDASEVFLGDFGLATTSATSESFFYGSGYYLSPESLGEEFGRKPYNTQISDVWSLGIILTNMITGRSPWFNATTSDTSFLRYMANPEYLRENLPISEGASAILQRTFTYQPSARITIPELRKMVLEVDTFFMSEEEIAQGNRWLQLAVMTYQPPARVPSIRSEDIGPLLLDEEPPVKRTISPAVVAVQSGQSSFVNYESDSDSDEGDMPITPATHPQDPEVLVEVPDMPEDSMGVPAIPEPQKQQEPGAAPVESLAKRLEQFAL